MTSTQTDLQYSQGLSHAKLVCNTNRSLKAFTLPKKSMVPSKNDFIEPTIGDINLAESQIISKTMNKTENRVRFADLPRLTPECNENLDDNPKSINEIGCDAILTIQDNNDNNNNNTITKQGEGTLNSHRDNENRKISIIDVTSKKNFWKTLRLIMIRKEVFSLSLIIIVGTLVIIASIFGG